MSQSKVHTKIVRKINASIRFGQKINGSIRFGRKCKFTLQFVQMANNKMGYKIWEKERA
mgnify:CR=1 FL=1